MPPQAMSGSSYNVFTVSVPLSWCPVPSCQHRRRHHTTSSSL